ncbi:hypothetical protein Q7P37_000825 [Cladosporium fusiforme]
MESLPLRELNPFEQQPNLSKLYTQLCYVFPVQDETAYSRIERILEAGLDRLADAFPWIAGQVVNEGAESGSSGTYVVRKLHRRPRLVIKDLRLEESTPNLESLKKVDYPVAMLDEDSIAPRKTLDMVFGQPSDPAEVFLVQANFITGGLLLTVATQHNTMDMTGQSGMTRLLSKACRGEDFTSEELRVGNMSSAGAIELLDSSVDVEKELSNQSMKPSAPQPTPEGPVEATPPPPECIWAFINFDAKSLATLKATATESITSDFISTDDALTAFIWQATTRARLPRLSPSRSITFARAIDPRRYLKEIPPSYPGLVQNMAYSTSTVEDLTSKPLGHAASLLRAAVDPKTSDLERNTRALATLLHRSEDKSSINVTGQLDLSADIMLSSWAAVKCYEDDFGFGLGKPEMVRRPGFTPVESLMYLLPRTPRGDVAAMVCLRKDDIERLKGDEVFMRLGRFVG